MEIKNRFLFDWLTFSSRIHSKEGIAELLGIPLEKFSMVDHGFLTYPQHMRFGNIVICYDDLRPERGVCCNMSGSGCREFEKYGTGDFISLLAEILENYNDEATKRDMNISRLDIANDVFDGSLDIEKCFEYQTKRIDEERKGAFVSTCKRTLCTAISSGDNGGVSVTFGSQRSNLFVRIYDKYAEQFNIKENSTFWYEGQEVPKEELKDGWVRNEIQLRDKNAIGFVKRMFEDGYSVSELFYGVVNNTFRYVEPSNDSNMRRWETAEFWLKYLDYLTAISIYNDTSPEEYTVERLNHYIDIQAVNAISTYIDIHGITRTLTMLQELRKDKPKYSNLINSCGVASDSIANTIKNLINCMGDVGSALRANMDDKYFDDWTVYELE